MKKRSAFSLVELSIVLVILGLLTGGILAGKSLIRSSELRSVITDHDRYKTAILTFRDKYFQLPGDTTIARTVWGSAGSGNACFTTLATTADSGTCDGDGNGLVEYANASSRRESHLVWNHLANAGLIQGKYIYDASTPQAGVTGPESKVSSAAVWGLCYTWQGNGAFGRPNANMLILAAGGWTSSACYQGNTAGLMASEVWNLDTKMDDGLATTGKMTAQNSYNAGTGCLSDNFSNEQLSSTYLTSSNNKACRVFWLLGL